MEIPCSHRTACLFFVCRWNPSPSEQTWRFEYQKSVQTGSSPSRYAARLAYGSDITCFRTIHKFTKTDRFPKNSKTVGHFHKLQGTVGGTTTRKENNEAASQGWRLGTSSPIGGIEFAFCYSTFCDTFYRRFSKNPHLQDVCDKTLPPRWVPSATSLTLGSEQLESSEHSRAEFRMAKEWPSDGVCSGLESEAYRSRFVWRPVSHPHHPCRPHPNQTPPFRGCHKPY
jgi:hypothetical protein